MVMMRGLIVVAGALLAGCYQPQLATGLPCAENGACPGDLECRAGRCELPGSIADASFDVPVDVAIDACAAATCQGADIVGCGAPVTCATACSSIGGAHCMVLVPSNGLTGAMLAGATADVTSIEDWTFYTDDGEIRRGNVYLRPAGTGVIGGIGFQVVDGMGVFTARSFNVSAGNQFEGIGTYPLVLFAVKTIVVSGQIDVGGKLDVGGPGGSSGTGSMTGTLCRGRAGRFFSSGFGEGGGGGGGRTSGGDGAASNQATPTGLGGGTCSTLVTTVPLRGGSGGGHGGNTSSNAGGGGGGALALVAMESITVSGSVGAPGAGGRSGAGPAPSGDGGGGGGGGGAVFIESPSVTISGALTANGGGGSAPFNIDGNRGSVSTATAAAGGSYSGPGGTRTGGRGGTGTLSPLAGQNYTQDDGLLPPTVIISRGGGGGGAAGRTEVRSLIRTTTGAVLSPTPAYSDVMLE
jgi:hypothetical protein